MMSFTRMQSTMAQLYRERHAPEHLKELADLWWWILLAMGVVFFIAAASFSAFELVRSRDVLNAAHKAGAVTPPALDKAALQGTVSSLEARAGLYSQMRANLSTTSDPSL